MPDSAFILIVCEGAGGADIAAQGTITHPSTGATKFHVNEGKSKHVNFPRGSKLSLTRQKARAGVKVENRTGRMLQAREYVGRDVLDGAVDNNKAYKLTRVGVEVRLLY